jgi:hypothetical protein
MKDSEKPRRDKYREIVNDGSCRVTSLPVWSLETFMGITICMNVRDSSMLSKQCNYSFFFCGGHIFVFYDTINELTTEYH